jgi:hypothetical protein
VSKALLLDHFIEGADFVILSFEDWQEQVVSILRNEFCQELELITTDEVDWRSWREFYEQGRSARAAVNRALERDI